MAIDQVLAENAEGWLDAVERRHSRRTFTGGSATPSQLAQLADVCARFRPYTDARAEFVPAPAADVFRGAVGSYGKITGAPHLLVVVAGAGGSAQHHAGYTGEGCILHATALGLDTCWVGGMFSREALREMLDLAPGERAVAVSPVGIGTPRASMAERIMRGSARASKRKSAEEIAPGLDASWPAWARAAVECARLAPSAINRQPWRFGLEGADLVVSSSGPELPAVTKALDCGIAMLHAELGALGAGVAGMWSDSVAVSAIARFTPHDTRSGS